MERYNIKIYNKDHDVVVFEKQYYDFSELTTDIQNKYITYKKIENLSYGQYFKRIEVDFLNGCDRIYLEW